MLPDSLLPETLSRIGKNLYRIRLEKKLKQSNVAYGLQINVSVDSQVERGCYYGLGFKLLDQFARYYEVSMDEIMLNH